MCSNRSHIFAKRRCNRNCLCCGRDRVRSDGLRSSNAPCKGNKKTPPPSSREEDDKFSEQHSGFLLAICRSKEHSSCCGAAAVCGRARIVLRGASLVHDGVLVFRKKVLLLVPCHVQIFFQVRRRRMPLSGEGSALPPATYTITQTRYGSLTCRL